MIRFETTDTEDPIQPDDGGADASGIIRGRVIHFNSMAHEPLWNECVMCHIKGTLLKTPVTGEDGLAALEVASEIISVINKA